MKKKKKQLKKQLEELPLWPHFAEVYNDNQYDSTIFQAIELGFNAVLDENEEYEAKQEKSYYNDRLSLDYKKIARQRKKRRKHIQKILDYCIEFIGDIKNLNNLIQLLAKRKEVKIMLKLTEHMFIKFNELSEKRNLRDNLKYKIQILTNEEKFLASRKKKLDPAQAEELEKWKAEYSLLEGQNLSTATADYQILDSIVSLIFSTTFKRKTELKEYLKKDLPEEWRPYWQEYIFEAEAEVQRLLFTYVKNTNSLISVAKSLDTYKEYDLALKVVEYTFTVLSEVRTFTENYTKNEQEFTTLQQEETQQHKVMKYLSQKKRNRLRELLLERNLRDTLPQHLRSTETQIDNLALEIGNLGFLISIKDKPDPSDVKQSTEASKKSKEEPKKTEKSKDVKKRR
jgi:hypothetical protein